MVTDSSKEIWIFLSHSNKDFEKVRFIRNYLEEHSCRPLMFYLKCLSNDDEIDNLMKEADREHTTSATCHDKGGQFLSKIQKKCEFLCKMLPCRKKG